MIAKSTAIKDRGGKSGERAVKAVVLTSGGLRRVSATRLRSLQEDLIAAQKSAEGIVGGSAPELFIYLIGWRGYFGFCQTPSA